ncbi:MAG: T9SS type A sorting domain-containing protein, partial [Candidatus Delongbacteria bacterium]
FPYSLTVFEGIVADINLPTGIEEPSTVASEFELYQNYPNPFNPATEIKFSLADNSKVNLSVYNTKGQLVRTLLDGKTEKGFHTVNFDASELNSEMYLYRLDVNGYAQIRKMIMLK